VFPAPRVRSAAASKFQGEPLRFPARAAAAVWRPCAGAARVRGSTSSNPPTRPATFCVRPEIQSGRTGVVVELLVVFEVFLLLVCEPLSLKLILKILCDQSRQRRIALGLQRPFPAGTANDQRSPAAARPAPAFRPR